jgi:hypothetical protein
MGKHALKKNTKKNKARKNKSRKVKLFKGGKCGCSGGDSKELDKMVGGYGPASFQPLPLRNFYDLTNPSDLSFPDNDRNTPILKTTPILTGGKKRKKIKNKISIKKVMHGGNYMQSLANIDPIINPNNIVSYTNSTPGAVSASNLLTGQNFAYKTFTDSPLLNISSSYNA